MSIWNSWVPSKARQGILVSQCEILTDSITDELCRDFNSEEAMSLVNISDPLKHYFVDDSALNVRGAKALGWNSYLFDEDGTAKVQPGEVDSTIKSLQGKLQS